MLIALLVAVVLGMIALLYLFLILPRSSDGLDHADLRVDYAHRGLHSDLLPENSMAAFRLAIAKGCGIELDVQLTADRQVVVFHDAGLKRMCGVNYRVAQVPLRELKKLRLAGSREQIPTLREVLELVDGQVPLLIELKGENGDPLLCQKVAALLDFYRGSFCVESFNPLYLRWFRAKRPRYPRAQLVGNLRSRNGKRRLLFFGMRWLLTNALSRPDVIACEDVHLNHPSVKLCTKLFGAHCLVWTVKSRDALLEQREAGRNSIFEGFFP